MSSNEEILEAFRSIRENLPKFNLQNADNRQQAAVQRPLHDRILCQECQIFQAAPCWLHATSIPDEPVIPFAITSLPKSLTLEGCPDSPTGKLVRAKEGIPLQTVFGPLVALVSPELQPSFLYAYPNLQGGGLLYYHLESEHFSNWLRYVRFADDPDEVNLAVYLKESQVVFVTTTVILPGEELKVAYSTDYAATIGRGAVTKFDHPHSQQDPRAQSRPESRLLSALELETNPQPSTHLTVHNHSRNNGGNSSKNAAKKDSDKPAVPANAPVSAGTKVSLTMAQKKSVPESSSEDDSDDDKPKKTPVPVAPKSPPTTTERKLKPNGAAQNVVNWVMLMFEKKDGAPTCNKVVRQFFEKCSKEKGWTVGGQKSTETRLGNAFKCAFGIGRKAKNVCNRGTGTAMLRRGVTLSQTGESEFCRLFPGWRLDSILPVVRRYRKAVQNTEEKRNYTASKSQKNARAGGMDVADEIPPNKRRRAAKAATSKNNGKDADVSDEDDGGAPPKRAKGGKTGTGKTDDGQSATGRWLCRLRS